MSLDKAIEKFMVGDFVIVTDDHTRENEGDFMLAASFATPEKVNFLTKYGRGLICVTITENRAKALELSLQPKRNTNAISCAFTVSVDAAGLVTSGISVEDRAKTIRIIANDSAKASSLTTPGHIFPVVGVAGGLKERQGHTEASIELCFRAGLYPSAVICEILAEDGKTATMKQIKDMANKFDIPIISVADLCDTLGEKYV